MTASALGTAMSHRCRHPRPAAPEPQGSGDHSAVPRATDAHDARASHRQFIDSASPLQASQVPHRHHPRTRKDQPSSRMSWRRAGGTSSCSVARSASTRRSRRRSSRAIANCPVRRKYRAATVVTPTRPQRPHRHGAEPGGGEPRAPSARGRAARRPARRPGTGTGRGWLGQAAAPRLPVPAARTGPYVGPEEPPVACRCDA